MAGTEGERGLKVAPEEKQEIRKRVQAHLRAVSASARQEAALAVRQRILGQEAWAKARTVLLYAPLRDELDLSGLLRDALETGKQAAFPKFDPATGQYAAVEVKETEGMLAAGYLGVLEPLGTLPPLPLNRLDFVVAPGVAFDLSGRRLGRGKGFYDRLLASVHGVKCGVGLDEQVEAVLPHEPHDVHVNCLATPSRWLEFGPASVLK